ncbi:MAG: undecaprenyl-diphosphate phosphatase [Candidatus Thorarchaeota archaeon]|nr:undecaprenyl-diphosphate phosphatase [Candidatus Thorarchaeota archaeon]
MEPWQIIVALIQGLVEWLPISSEGQAILFVYNFSAIPPESLIGFVVWLHLGTALAVIVRYPRTILDVLMIKDRKLFRQLLIATVCTAITAIPLYIIIKNSIILFNGEIINILVGVLLLVTAFVLYLPTRTSEERIEYTEPTDRIAAATGFIQGFSVFPGLSRSGVTVSALLMQKVDKETALRFSFLMSVPAVLGILAIELLNGDTIMTAINPLDLLVIEIIVFIVGLASMEFLLRVARKVEFWKLCVILAVIAILFGIPALL